MVKEFNTLSEFISFFNGEEACRRYFEGIRFAGGDFCPLCKHPKIQRFSDGKRYRCASCRKDFTIKTGTLFGESKIPLQKWFIAIYLLTTRKKGISSIELAEQVGVTQKTGWYMDHRIREAMKQTGGNLFGTVEIDETYIGGKHKRRHGFRKKSPVMGMTERGGKIRVFHIEATEAHIILDKIRKNIDRSSLLMTDEASVYRKLPKMGYRRAGVKHGKREYVRGNVHTNSIESYWALFKRGYHGTYHTMSRRHLQRYVDEFAFRFNARKTEMSEKFLTVVQGIAKSGKLSYKTLTA